MFDFFKKKNAPETVVDDKAPDLDVLETPTAEEEKLSWSEKLKAGLSKTRQNLGGQITSLFSSGKIDEETYEEVTF